MTPQERQLIDQLFDRLATVESAPRDQEAVRAINDGLDRAPHALYALVQTVLVQDEALKRADARIRAMEAELGGEPEARPGQGSFLDNMRGALFGHNEARAPTPDRGGASPWNNTGAERRPMGLPPGVPQGQPAPQGAPWAGGQPAPQATGGGGGSFLGTAAATVAGVVGGAMLMNSMKGMFGGEQGKAHSAFDQPSGSQPWDQPGGNALGREAGLDDVSRGGERTAAYDNPGNDRQGLFDVAENNADDGGYDDGGGDIGGGDSDYA